MSNLSKRAQAAVRVVTVLTAVATVLSLSGVAYLAPNWAHAATPADYGLHEGNTISAAGSDDPDVYIVNEMGYKRLFLNPAIFGLYGHLGGFASVKNVSPATRDAFPTSGLFRVDGDEKVYGIETTGEDVASLHWVNTSGAQAVADDPNFFKKVFVINAAEKALYASGANYTSVSQVPAYTRGGSVPVATGPLSVSLAPGNPAATTVTKNASGVEFMRVRFSGSGTVNTMTVKRLGAGETNDFSNVYIYDGARRLVSGKSFSSSNGETTFLVSVPVSGTKDLSIVADMDKDNNTAGNVNYVQLSAVTLSGGASVSGVPVSGNNMTSAGASSGRLDVALSGSLSNPTVGQKQAELSEFKLTANTEAASVRRLTMINGGTVKAGDITNLKLTTGTNTWTGTSTSDGYFVFDLGSGYTISKGSNAIFKVWGDLSGKKDETVDPYFENAADLYAVGDQYGQGMSTASGTSNQGIDALDAASESPTLTLQGGALTLVFNGPSATTVGTQVSDVTLLRYSMTAASNIEVRKTEFTLCVDTTGDGTFDAAADETEWDELNDFKVWNEATNTVVMGPKDGTAFDDVNDSGSCPDSATGAQEKFTDVFDLMAGQTYNFKVTADIDTSLGGTLTAAGSIIRAVLDDYSDDAGDVTVMKYSGTNTAVAAADIVPRADISGSNVTLSASSLTLSLAGSPASATTIRGTKNVNVAGITFAAGQASALKITTIKLTGYTSDEPAGTYDEGVDPDANDTGVSVANAMSSVRLYEAGTDNLIAGSDKVSNNSLGTAGTGTLTFSNLDWNIPAGTSKTVLVRADLSNNTASGTGGDGYAFDIGATNDVTALDADSKTVNAGNAKVNGTVAAPTKVLTVKGSGSMTLATSSDSPVKGSVYWGQLNAPISKFRLSSTDEGQYVEKLTIAASNSSENVDAANTVKNVSLTYKNKAGATLTTSQSFGNGASVNFAWAPPATGQEGTSSDLRPYVPKDSSLNVAVNADMKTKAEGATQDGANAVFFSLDLVDKFNGSHTDGFRVVGEGSGTVIDGTGTNINDVLGANDQYVYRVFPRFDQLPYPANETYNLIGSPTVFRFSITAMGLSDSNLRFDNEAVPSGSIKFEIISSGTPQGGDTSVSVLDQDNVVIDTVTLTDDANLSSDASYTFDFTSADVEIQGGTTKTYTIRMNDTAKYTTPSAVGVGADFWQVVLNDTSASDTNLVNWVGNYAGVNTAEDTQSTAGVLKTLPLYGPVFTRQ